LNVRFYIEDGIIELDGRLFWVVVKPHYGNERVEWFLEELTEDEVQNFKKNQSHGRGEQIENEGEPSQL